MFRCNDRFSGRYINQFFTNIITEPNTDYCFSFDLLGGAVGVWVNHCFTVREAPTNYFDRCTEWTTHTVRFHTLDNHDKQTAFEDWGLCFFKKINSLYVTGFEDSYIDNVRLIKESEPSINLIDGGDFEAPLDDAVYDAHWRPRFLGDEGAALNIALTTDPKNTRNHCLLLPKLIDEPATTGGLRVCSFGFYKNIAINDVRLRDPLGSPRDLLLFAENGKIVIKEEKYTTVTTGSAVYIPRGTPLNVSLKRGKNASYYWLSFCAEKLASVLTHDERIRVFTPQNMTSLTTAVDAMLQFPTEHPLYPYAVSGHSQAIVTQLFFEAEASENNHHSTLLERVIDRLNENPALSVNNEELAESCGFSVGHFIRLFKQYYGCTPHQYKIRITMQTAAEQLRGTSLSVKEISHALGFDNPLYFSNAFRNFHGISPTAYRAAHKK